MSHLFAVPPSPWEVDHAAGILAGLRYQEAHDGALPDTPTWRALERRHDLAPVRFTHWHPNISMMIERERREAVGCMPGPTLAGLTVDPPVVVASVPEPSSLALCVALACFGFFAIGVLNHRVVLARARDAIDRILGEVQ